MILIGIGLFCWLQKPECDFLKRWLLTPKDFDFSKQSLSINKTWDYKGGGGIYAHQKSSRRSGKYRLIGKARYSIF